MNTFPTNGSYQYRNDQYGRYPGPPSPGGLGSAMMSANAATFQPGRGMPGLSPRGSFGEQGTPMYAYQQRSQSGSTQGQRSPASSGLSLNAAAPAFQMGGNGGGMQRTLLSPGGMSPIMGGLPSPGGLSPSSPNARIASSPNIVVESAGFPFGVNNNNGGGWGAASINGNRQTRKGRGPPPVIQPIRTTGHNSTPSVSLNPAAFAAALASQKPKRKVTVKLPIEIELEGQENVFRHTITEEKEGDQRDDAVNALRKHWIRREPLSSVNVNDVGQITPSDCILSRDTFPSLNDNGHGLPDFVDIFLPGQSAWEEVRETFALERMEKEALQAAAAAKEAEKFDTSDEIDAGWGLGTGGGDGGTFGLSPDKQRNRYSNEEVSPLNDILTPRRAAHMTTMSLSLSSSGKPFGPATLTALGLPSPSEKQGDEKAYSDSEDRSEPALGARPRVDRQASDPAILSNISTPTKSSHNKNMSWRDLGRGFGYDIPEADEEDLSDDEEVSQTMQSSKRTLEHDLDMQSNPSEDADASDLDEDVDKTNGPSWLKERRQVSNMPFKAITGDESIDNGMQEDSDELETLSEDYSNPSDEEAARAEKRLQRAERLAAKEAENFDRDHLLFAGNRPRAGTAETFASSTLGGGTWHPQSDTDPHAGRPSVSSDINVMSRGPLDSASTFRANAPAFTPSDPNLTAKAPDHFRLPSIANSSFGGSFKGSTSMRGNLNAAAPSFVPGSFTFTAPSNAPKLPQLSSAPTLIPSRESQGREKRVRHQGGEQAGADEDALMVGSPPRPKPSAASVPSALRDGDAINGTSAPPFNSSIPGNSSGIAALNAAPQPTLGTFSFQPTAAPFHPTIGRNAGRAGIPSFEPPATEDRLSTVPQTSFTFSLPRSQSISLRRPDEPSPFMKPIDIPKREREELISNPDDEIRFDDDEEDGDDDDDTVSDIIEELGERMDRALEGWAGKILDEVTIMGQVRPVNMVTLDSLERKTLVEAFSREIGNLLADHNDVLEQRFMELKEDEQAEQSSRIVQEKLETLLEHVRKIEESAPSDAIVASQKAEDAEGESTLDKQIGSLGDKVASLLMEHHDRLQERLSQLSTQAQADEPLRLVQEKIGLLFDHVQKLEGRTSDDIINASKGELAFDRQIGALDEKVVKLLADHHSHLQERHTQAEKSSQVVQENIETLLAHVRKLEENRRDDVALALSRAAKAEGELAALEKRISDQDTKIGNLQQVNATQKQKAAQSGQKLSETEKRIRELEASDRELHVARARLQDMEGRLADRADLEKRLQNSTESEARLREELAGYQARFLDMERDLMSMRETLVGKDELEQSQADLTSAREELAELRGQLGERDRRIQEQKEQYDHQIDLQVQRQNMLVQQIDRGQHLARSSSTTKMPDQNGLPHSPSHGSTTWASIYAPSSGSNENQKSTFVDQSFDSTRNNLNDTVFSSHQMRSNLSNISNSRAVELSNDGWWS
ncbi:uncharacterized protein FA14DRAFT_161977 [Meira miltonrushii]|uniref:Uncharacterized protein n=1 Tax=Meira miltonrushii TaxID=1280837 RepID=A0A316V4Y0_9BASI|nr:uncharacterized protein FA14DRAFT_161977 [Meira miltonrushii]PWN32617.1 hypothetical protein FA14DRAFT_161977 [Meira miltonrushii]